MTDVFSFNWKVSRAKTLASQFNLKLFQAERLEDIEQAVQLKAMAQLFDRSRFGQPEYEEYTRRAASMTVTLAKFGRKDEYSLPVLDFESAAKFWTEQKVWAPVQRDWKKLQMQYFRPVRPDVR